MPSFGTGASSLAWQVGSALKLRGIIFDKRAILRLPTELAPPGAPSSQLPTAAIRRPEDMLAVNDFGQMLMGEMRELCMRRGLSIIGERGELEARLKAAVEKAAAEAGTGTGGAAANALRSRYAEKLRSRGAAGLLHESEADAGPGGVTMAEFGKVEKQRERAVRAHVASETSAQADQGGYAFQRGAKDLMVRLDAAAPTAQESSTADTRRASLLSPLASQHYLDMRGMQRAFLGDDRDPASPSGHSQHGQPGMEKQAASLAEALRVPPFALSLGAHDVASIRRGEPLPLIQAAEALALPPHTVMLVSDSTAAISAARAAKLLSCYVAKRIEGRPRRYPADFCVADFEEITDCIEEINGATFRDNNTEIISKYVGGE